MDPDEDRPDQLVAQGADLVELLSRKIVGQASALEFIIPYIKTYQAGLNTADRPAGVFLLLGPTGTGKTRTVEALAETLHGSAKHLLKIDCAEYQSDHEVAKLIGAPPGYVGHRETRPLLTQERLQGVISSDCDLALVLFDEIEKAAPALTTLLLGVLDKATLHLGDNSVVNFERALIFLTSNLGAREMLNEVRPEIGFHSSVRRPAADLVGKLESIALSSVRKRFSPEFVNRIDAVITYRPLDAASLSTILDHHITELQRHVHTRLGERSFEIDVSAAGPTTAAREGLQPGIWRTGIEADDSSHADAAPGRAGRGGPGRRRRPRGGGARRVRRPADTAVRSAGRRVQPGHATSDRARPRRQLRNCSSGCSGSSSGRA